jgi:hypothetical protein
MRYVFLAGGLTLVLAAGLALGQQPNVQFVPVQNNQGLRVPIAVAQPGQEAEAETDEMTRLNTLDLQLGQKVESLVKQLADTTDENDRAKVKQSLQETLAQQFDTQQKVRELEVADVEARVKKLRDIITKRNDARRTIIEKRLDQLVREAEGLGWNSPAGGPVVYAPNMPARFFGYSGAAGGKGGIAPVAPATTPRAK